MASRVSRARKEAEKLQIPGGKELAGIVTGQLQEKLTAPVERFQPSVSEIGTQAQTGLADLLAAPVKEILPPTPISQRPDIQAPELAQIAAPDIQAPEAVTPRQVEPFTPSALEQQARDADTKKFVQQVRDSVAARGLNQSDAGAFIEGELLLQRNLKLAQQDFQRTRQLVAEELQQAEFKANQAQQLFQNQFALGQQDIGIQEANQRAQQQVFQNQMAVFSLELQANQNIFSQEFANKEFSLGREGQLFQQKFNVVQAALKRSNIDFNQQQIEFAMNLEAEGLPLQQGIQLMGLIQQGNIAGANLIADAMAIDAKTKSSLFSSIGSVVGTVGGAAIGFFASGGNPLGVVAGAGVGSSVGGSAGRNLFSRSSGGTPALRTSF